MVGTTSLRTYPWILGKRVRPLQPALTDGKMKRSRGAGVRVRPAGVCLQNF